MVKKCCDTKAALLIVGWTSDHVCTHWHFLCSVLGMKGWTVFSFSLWFLAPITSSSLLSLFSSRGAAWWNPSSLGWECGTCHHWKEWVDCTSPQPCGLGIVVGLRRWFKDSGRQLQELAHFSLQNIEVTCGLIKPGWLVQHAGFQLREWRVCGEQNWGLIWRLQEEEIELKLTGNTEKVVSKEVFESF